MAEETETTDATETDIFKQQEKTIDLLYDVLQAKIGQQPAISYVSPATPDSRPPNYIAYAGAALIVIYVLFMKKRS